MTSRRPVWMLGRTPGTARARASMPEPVRGRRAHRPWRRPAVLAAAALIASSGTFVVERPAEAALAGTAPASMCEATNPSVTDPGQVGDARRVTDVLVVGDTVYLAGKFTHLISSGTTTPIPRNHIGACSLSTGQVLPWAADADDVVFSLAADGTSIYAGGSFNAIGGQARAHLAALDPQSGAVRPWAPSVAGGDVRALMVSGGTLYAGGTFKGVNGMNRNALAALSTHDASLTGWDPGSRFDALQLYEVRALVHWQSKVVVGEWLDNPMNNLFAVDDRTGAPLPWRTTPSQSQPVLGLSVAGSRIYAAVAGTGGHVESFDPSSGSRKWDVRVDGNVQGIWATSDVVYAGGHFENVNGSLLPAPQSRAIAIAADDTGTVLSWNPGVDHVGNGLYAVEGGAGSLLLGGEFTNMAGRPQQGISRFGASFVPPSVTSVSPGTLTPGSPQTVVVSGSGFSGDSPALSLGPGVDLSSVTLLSPTQIQATATVQSSAPAGPHAAMVVSDGLTGVCSFCLTVSGTTGGGGGGGSGGGGSGGGGGGGSITPGPGGYRLVARDGGIFAFGDATFKGSTGNIKLAQPIVGMTSTPSGQGYWLTAADGGIFAFGDATFKGSTGNIKLAQPIVGMATTPSGQGYWLVARDGGIFAFGDATFKGSTGNIKLAQPIVGMTSTPSGQGYWLTAADGGIFAFGDATFKGSTGNIKLAKPIIGMTSTKSGQGYWMVASDGGIFAFGDAMFKGSTGNIKLAQPIVAIASTSSGQGYWMVASDGGIFAFGDAPFKGSTGNIKLAQPIVGMARS